MCEASALSSAERRINRHALLLARNSRKQVTGFPGESPFQEAVWVAAVGRPLAALPLLLGLDAKQGRMSTVSNKHGN